MLSTTRIHLVAFAALYLAICAGALCACSAMAGAEELSSKTVHYADLDLSRPAGAQVLYRRIRAAANDVCHLSTASLPEMRGAATVCIDRSIDDAVRRVNAPLLTELRFASPTIRLARR